tara:strand:+ start:4438 stop:4812 length:375 start_codon:yes stop_codon:yes gene_type:complete
MIEPQEFARRAEALRQQFEAQLGVKSRDLRHAFRRAGRLLPRRLRGQGAVLAKAERDIANPRLARQMDGGTLRAAFDRVSEFLRSVDVADRRRARLLSLAAVVAFNLIAVFAVFVVWLWWRGYV